MLKLKSLQDMMVPCPISIRSPTHLADMFSKLIVIAAREDSNAEDDGTNVLDGDDQAKLKECPGSG